MKSIRGNGIDRIIRIMLIFAGSVIYSIGINLFIIPHGLLSGGVTGVALLIHYMTQIAVGTLVFILNIPIFIIGLNKINREFILLSLVGMISMSFSLVITRPFRQYMIQDILLSCIYGGVLMGIGGGIVFRQGASLGGTDIISVIIKKERGINISTVLFSINLIIVSLGMLIGRNLQVALYTLISMYIASLVVGRVIEGLERKKMLFIITAKEEEVSTAIMKEIGRGVTYLSGEGAYTGEIKKILYCIVSTNQLVKAKNIVEKIDNSAFMTITDISEVQGKGFVKPRL
jgi:uncharacterized membrane-anchored protein YitT (DUF2179 family)